MSSLSHHEGTSAADDARAKTPSGASCEPPASCETGPAALTTFVFEASAGGSRDVGNLVPEPARRLDSAHLETPHRDSSPADGLEDEDDEILLPAVETWPVVRSANSREKWRRTKGRPADRPRAPAVQIEPAQPAPERAGPRSATGGASPRPPRRLSAWSASLAVHGLLVAALSLVTITQLRPRAIMDLVMAPAELENLEAAEPELPAPEGPGEQLEQMVNEVPSQVIDPGKPTLGMEEGPGLVGDLVDAVALTGGGGAGADDGPLGGLGGAGGMLGDGTGGSATYGSGLGGAPTAQFFGTKIEGRRIVFVLDNSGSMQGGRLETVIAELKRSVEALGQDQEFYVIFYSDAPYPLFYPRPVDRYIRPTDRNKKQLAAWLETVELCLGDAVGDAMAAAVSIEPDTVFLLSDGRIQGEKKMQFLLTAGGGRFPIHTVGVGLGRGATVARQNLQEIAAANGGDFRDADVPAEMLQQSRQRPRPYHNKGPGPIWGRSVKPWGGR